MEFRSSRSIPNCFFICSVTVGSLFALIGNPSPAMADESPFASIYTTEVMPAGTAELEQWLTWASDKIQERFDTVQGRSELEYGFSDRFLGSLYANYEWT